jgi:hypothetical protein
MTSTTETLVYAHDFTCGAAPSLRQGFQLFPMRRTALIGVPLARVGDRLLYVGEVVEFDQPIERERAPAIHLNQVRDEELGDRVALHDPAQGPAGQQGVQLTFPF